MGWDCQVAAGLKAVAVPRAAPPRAVVQVQGVPSDLAAPAPVGDREAVSVGLVRGLPCGGTLAERCGFHLTHSMRTCFGSNGVRSSNLLAPTNT